MWGKAMVIDMHRGHLNGFVRYISLEGLLQFDTKTLITQGR